MCTIADELRADWYKTTIQINGVATEEQKKQMAYYRQTIPYQEALAALMNHMIDCPICEQHWNPPKVEEDGLKPWMAHVKHNNSRDYTDV